MEELELKKYGMQVADYIRNEEMSDDEIIDIIKKTPELIHMKLLSDSNLFVQAVIYDRKKLMKMLVHEKCDINIKCPGSLILGNALNVAYSEETAEYLLGLGLQIEKNLNISEDSLNPAIVAVRHNNSNMVLYWFNKQKQLFGDDDNFIKDLLYNIIDQVIIYNQKNMLIEIFNNDEMYETAKQIYKKVDDLKSIKLDLSALRRIKEPNLEDRKKELRSILNKRKKEISLGK